MNTILRVVVLLCYRMLRFYNLWPVLYSHKCPEKGRMGSDVELLECLV